MSKFFTLPINIKPSLIRYFEDKPPGTKIKHGTCASTILPAADSKYVFQNSIIKLKKDTYIIGRGHKAIVGEGTFGKVKYVLSIAEKEHYVLKIIRVRGVHLEQYSIKNELGVLKDLGLYQDAGLRQLEVIQKQYIVMVDAGLSLDKYLKYHSGLEAASRFDLAIELCWTLHNLHHGNASRTNKAYAHGDLKPANIAVKKGHIRLVDVGCASEDPEHIPLNLVGAPAYLPNLTTFLTVFLTTRELDVFALKRVIYMPNKVLCLDGLREDNAGQHFGAQMLLSEGLLSNSPCLSRYFDTGVKSSRQRVILKRNYHDDPLFLASVLILEEYGLLNSFEHKLHIPELVPVIVGVYFANKKYSKKEIAHLLIESTKTYIRCKVLAVSEPCSVKLALLAHFIIHGLNNNLKQALENNTLIHLLALPSISINKAACLLWQHGVCEERLLEPLKANENLALSVIDLIFDDNLNEARNKLQSAIKATRISSTQCSLSLEENEKKKGIKPLIKSNSTANFSVKLPPLFFSRPKQGLAEQAEALNVSPIS